MKASSQPAEPRSFKTDIAAIIGVFGPEFDKLLTLRKGSVARAKGLEELSKRPLIDIKGKNAFRCYSVNTLRRYLAEYEAKGAAALVRRKRRDAGVKSVILSKEWDQQVPFDDAKKREIAEKLKKDIRSYWAHGYKRGAILFRASFALEKMTREAGFEPPPGLCRVPHHFVGSERLYRSIHVKNTDRKTFEDKRERVWRSYDALVANEQWFGDCHKCDVILKESADYQRHAVFITWIDAATLRVHIDVVILPKGKGITNSHVSASLLRAMKSLGVPQSICIDNGSEFYNVDFIADLLKLRCGDDRQVIVHSIPHNPQGKAILEGFFANFEQNYLGATPGQIGGNRMASKIANGGRKPVSWPLDEGAFFRHIANNVHIYHHMPQKGRILKGLSPFEAYQKQIDTGFERVEIDEEAFIVAFSVLKRVAVGRAGISHAGRQWTCDAISSYPGDHVLIRVPKYDDWANLPVYDEKERFLGWAAPKQAFDFHDREGAKESGRLTKLAREGIHTLAEDTHSIDPIADAEHLAAMLPAPPVAPSTGVVTTSDTARDIIKRVKESPKAKREREDAARRREAEEQLALGAEFFAKFEARKAQNT
ncbi:transposase family protein [Methylosinus sp. KRF6]|uniref:integrase catalytic domain-containing protein n=1 Tax=Methylosinus sp. KRF6 TaxID=2846853 RepID=UPI001C0D35BC|nr:transposase family protein [Methylosinus sp. KRF6]MBU3889859.1 transposase family protein [Methylosinus sp. KRF6]